VTDFSHMDVSSEHFDIAEWFLIGRAREIPSLVPPSHPQINLGAGRRQIGTSMALDLEHGWDGERDPIPFPDGSVGTIWAHAFLSYLDRPDPIFRECARVLRVGGTMNIVEPHGNSDLWNEDPRRRTRYTEESWRTLFHNPWYETEGAARLQVHACFVIGVVWRNMSLFTQLVKR
jgi:SAM-dependent methyltransferase